MTKTGQWSLKAQPPIVVTSEFQRLLDAEDKVKKKKRYKGVNARVKS